MSADGRRRYLGCALTVAMALAGKTAFAQKPSTEPPPNMPTPTTKDTAATPTTTTTQVGPSKKELAAIKAFRDVPSSDPDKKIQSGEEFLQNYSDSRFRVEVIDFEAKFYLSKGQIDKLQAAGDRELAAVPNNPQALADICSNFSRGVTPSTPDFPKRLDQAQVYCKKSLELLATVQKAPDASDEAYTTAKNQTSAMAYSGLGVVAYRKKNYPEAISNLEQAVKLEKSPDPVNYYILGKAYEGAAHFSDAVAAFTKCAAVPGGLQSPCNSSIAEAKSLEGSKLDTPK